MFTAAFACTAHANGHSTASRATRASRGSDVSFPADKCRPRAASWMRAASANLSIPIAHCWRGSCPLTAHFSGNHCGDLTATRRRARHRGMTAYQLAKRLIDIILASAILLLAFPALILAALLILVLEGRPIFYISRRMISVDRSIPIVKFRTMVRDAKSPKYRLEERFMRDGYLDIPRTCEVYTGIGRLLERIQLVEVPQMFNVLFNGMSLIGNRPLPADNIRLLKKYPGWQRRFDSPAGISGIAQVVGKLRLEPYERLALESAYSDLYRSGNIVRCDMTILFYTAKFILTSEGLTRDQAFRLLGVENYEL